MRYTLYLSVIGLVLFGLLPTGNSRNVSSGFSGILKQLSRADSAYFQRDFGSARNHYAEALNGSSDPLPLSTHFKFAVSAFRAGHYTDAISEFRELEKKGYLKEYARYFRIRSLWQTDSAGAARESEAYIANSSNGSLKDSLYLTLADYHFDRRNFSKARQYYQAFRSRKVDKSKFAYSYIRAAHALYYQGRRLAALDEFSRAMNVYTGNEETLELVRWLEKPEASFYRENFFKVVDVYHSNGRFDELRDMLEEYAKAESDPAKKEKARYQLIKIYYAKGEYSTALYGFKNMLSELTNKTLEPYIRLHIARIYWRKGYRNQSVEAYSDYADRYPRRRIAPEAMWKAAWIAEESGDLDKAQDLYKTVRKRWPSSGYAREAMFREGFTHFRQGEIKEAEDIFNAIRFKRWPDVDRNRATFWASLCSENRGDNQTAKRLRVELAREPWDDYYTMKSYLMEKEQADSLWNFREKFSAQRDELVHYASGFQKLMGPFEEAFEVKDVLGEHYAFVALENIKARASDRDEWMALAEIYKKLGAYARAYRAYDYIDRKYYSNISYNDKLVILRERFPYYYDSHVQEYASRFGVEPELVLAIMKQESVFDNKAQSWANAYGLMQLVPATGREMATYQKIDLSDVNRLFNAEINIRLGTYYVKRLLGSLERKEHVLAAYNAGPHRVKRWLKLPGSRQIDVFIENVEYSETRDYVRKVMKNYWAYKVLNNNFLIGGDQLLLGDAE